MRHAQTPRLSRRRVKQLLSKAMSHGTAGDRMEVFSRRFLGHPYKSNPLVGSAETPEEFIVSLDSFDCVTYIETILALSLASSDDEFVDWLRKLRYEHGRIAWERRNHYMTGWIRSNIRGGTVRPLDVPAVALVWKDRTLDDVPGLPPTRVQFTCVPKRSVTKLFPHVRTGDLIFFASTRKHLDVFHCGLIVRDERGVFVRHASRSRGAVVEQPLEDFLKANRMAGVIIARPKERRT